MNTQYAPFGHANSMPLQSNVAQEKAYGTNTPRPKIALMIDCENTSYHHVELVLNHLKQLGDVCVRRAYANWRSPHMNGWQTVITKYGLSTYHQMEHVSGKNASDIAISIDAIELAFQQQLDVFCLVSSDSDFTPLCLKLREYGKQVIGMGRMNASKSLVNACNQFHYFDKQHHQSTATHNTHSQSSYRPSSTSSGSAHHHGSQGSYKSASHPHKRGRNPNYDKRLIDLIKTAINEQGRSGELPMATMGQVLRQAPHIDISYYGAEKVTELLHRMHDFEVFEKNKVLMVRVQKPQTASSPKVSHAPTMLVEKTSSDAIMKNTALINAIGNAMAHLQHEGQASVQQVEEHLVTNFGIDSSDYGYTNFIELLKNLKHPFAVIKKRGVYYVTDSRFEPHATADESSTTPNESSSHALSSNQHANNPFADSNPNPVAKNDAQNNLTNGDWQDDVQLNETLLQAIRAHEQEDGWARLADVGNQARIWGYDLKQFGHHTVSALIDELPGFSRQTRGTVTYVKALRAQTTHVEASDESSETEFEIDSKDAQTTEDVNDEESSKDSRTEDDLETTVNAYDEVSEVAESDSTDAEATSTDTDITSSLLELYQQMEAEETAFDDSDTDYIEPNAELIEDIEVTENIENIENIESSAERQRAERDDENDVEAHETVETGDTGETEDGLVDESVISQEDSQDALQELAQAIHQAIQQHKDAQGWTKAGDIGKYARRKYGISSKDFGYATFAELLADVEEVESKTVGRALYIRVSDE